MKIFRKRLSISFLLITFFILSPSITAGQKGVRAFGIQFKPIIPFGLVNTDGQTVRDLNTETTLEIQEKRGMSIGAVIRFGLSKRFSFETGINYVQRNYHFNLNSVSIAKYSEADLRFTGYEIPALGMVFVRLGDKMYMNAAAGLSFDFFPTGGVATYDQDTSLTIEYGMLETNWIQLSLLANLGFEYRTEKNGYFYLGASYHRPFSNMAEVYISYIESNSTTFVRLISPPPGVSGNYLSIDIRYFFNPGKNKRKKE